MLAEEQRVWLKGQEAAQSPGFNHFTRQSLRCEHCCDIGRSLGLLCLQEIPEDTANSSSIAKLKEEMLTVVFCSLMKQRVRETEKLALYLPTGERSWDANPEPVLLIAETPLPTRHMHITQLGATMGTGMTKSSSFHLLALPSRDERA